VLFELAREGRLDARRHELLLSARQRLLQGALDEAVGDGDLGDLVVLQVLLELAVGDLRDLWNFVCFVTADFPGGPGRGRPAPILAPDGGAALQRKAERAGAAGPAARHGGPPPAPLSLH
jgi:hypothetical protein